ncbi:MAG TPA: helix-turn-helix transcriptional regulator [Candidatus Stercorousia faecigallinarum]|nr:helix-turn-helix transcriptional regulator [Candidatus Stercorousia faecigallinarum]
MSDFKKLLGKKIQSIRKAKGLTQEKLAELIDIETPSLSYLETGKYAPSVETLQKLSKVLDVKPWEFYFFTDLSDEDKKNELKKALDENPKLIKMLYNFYKSINC